MFRYVEPRVFRIRRPIKLLQRCVGDFLDLGPVAHPPPDYYVEQDTTMASSSSSSIVEEEDITEEAYIAQVLAEQVAQNKALQKEGVSVAEVEQPFDLEISTAATR